MKEGSVTVQTASPKVCFLAALGLQTSWERSGEAGKGGGAGTRAWHRRAEK